MIRNGLLIFLGIVVLDCMGIPLAGLDVLAYLVAGWAMYLFRVIPKVQVRWALVLSAMVYAAALLAGAHWFLRWLYREMKSTTAPAAAVWQSRWTLSGFLIIVLMFLSGMAAIGVAHQTAWLINSPEPLFRYRYGREAANRVKCRANLKSIGGGLKQFAHDYQGHYPDTLADLIIADEISRNTVVCPSSNADPTTRQTRPELTEQLNSNRYCSYAYLGKGLTEPVPDDRVLVIESLSNHQYTGAHVLYGDGHVDFLKPVEVRNLQESLHLPVEESHKVYWRTTTFPTTQPSISPTR